MNLKKMKTKNHWFERHRMDEKDLNSWVKNLFSVIGRTYIPWILESMTLNIHRFPGHKEFLLANVTGKDMERVKTTALSI
jgi:hypothetical protein